MKVSLTPEQVHAVRQLLRLEAVRLGYVESSKRRGRPLVNVVVTFIDQLYEIDIPLQMLLAKKARLYVIDFSDQTIAMMRRILDTDYTSTIGKKNLNEGADYKAEIEGLKKAFAEGYQPERDFQFSMNAPRMLQ